MCIVAMFAIPVVSKASDHAKNVKATHFVCDATAVADVVFEVPAEAIPMVFVETGTSYLSREDAKINSTAFKPFEDADAYSWRQYAILTHNYWCGYEFGYKSPVILDPVPIPRRC